MAGSLRVLDPLNEPGRVTLITRYGSKKIRQFLPAHIKAVQAAGLKVGRLALAQYRETRTVTPSNITYPLAP